MKLAVLAVFVFPFVLKAQTIEHSAFSDSVEISSSEESIVDSAFNFITSELGFMDFEDCNNCNSRAHLVSAIIEKQFPGVKSAKAWLFADFKRASKEEFYKLKKPPYLAPVGECDNWGYHVAPVVIVSDGDRIDTVILDPSTQNKPVSLHKWASDLAAPGSTSLLVIKDKKYFSFPDNDSKKFEDMQPEWTDVDKSLYDNDYSKSIEKVLISKRRIREHWVFSSDVKKIKNLLNNDEN